MKCYKPGWYLAREVANEVGGHTQRLLPAASLTHTAGTLSRASNASSLDRTQLRVNYIYSLILLETKL